MTTASIQDLMEQIERDRAVALPDAAKLGDFRDYARGTQSIDLTPGERRIIKNSLQHNYSDNLCKAALQALTNPLRILRFDVDDNDVPQQQQQTPAISTNGNGATPPPEPPKTPAEIKSEWIERAVILNNLPTLQKLVHWSMCRDGDHAVAVSWYVAPGQKPQDGRALFQRESFWNGVQGVWPAYDDNDRVDYWVKEWNTDDGLRRTVWWPDRIERYIQYQQGTDWQPFILDSDNRQWPVPWIDSKGQPLNPPLVHFANVQMPNDGRGDATDAAEPDSRYGMSELDGGVLGIQDSVNRIHLDILSSANFAGFPMLALLGFRAQLDANGVEAPYVIEPGAVIRSDDPASRVERIQPGSLAETERALMIELQSFSRATTIPIHKLITSDEMSGVSRILSMLDYFEKLEAIAAATAPQWASLMHKATRLANTFGKAGLDETLHITTVFAPVIRYDPLTQSQIATAIAPFVSEREVLRLLNYTPSEQDKIMDEKDDDRANAPAPPPVVVAPVSTPDNGATLPPVDATGQAARIEAATNGQGVA